jgi:phospholipid-transporting ATPase
VYYGENSSDMDKNKIFPNNTITTTKYNIITFLPKSLLYQFKRAANIYFLVVSILTFMSFSPKQPSSMVGTFAFVLFCTMVKEAIEDYSRYKQDSQSNNKYVTKLYRGNWIEVKCWSLRPGDIVKVKKEEEFSADTIIIKSSSDTGYCFIDTKNLDGETNLKDKCAIEEFKDVNENNLSNIHGSIDCERPNENLTSWEGVVVYNKNQIYASLKNLILKGCTLKNTDYVIGILVYCGHNTKIMKNSKRPRQKVSKVLLTMNTLLYSLFIIDIFICIIFACFSFAFVRNNAPNYKYIFPNYDPNALENYPIVLFGYAFLTFFVAYSQIIPISLYVALELVKIIQGFLIFYDAEIYDLDLKKPATCRTTDLIEELGQVEFIFSDKTGTLTQNSMVLKKCFVNNKIYGMNQTEKEDCKFTINGDLTAAHKIQSDNYDDKKDKQKLEDFFFLLALCHNVFPEKTDKGVVYQGSSPDDIALVKGAQQLGIEFASKDFNDLVLINHLTRETSKYEVKCEMPFDSDRKRMSVVVQDKASKRLIVLSKGADNIMLGTSGNLRSLVNKFSNDKEFDNINIILNSFSKEGLRILVMGQKFLDEKRFQDWEKRHNELRNKGKNLNELYAELECDLQFVGCSAIEDKLQEGVADTIYNLLNCGIRIWVLTGDKQDTAIEIAKSCKLIDETMHILDLSTDPDSVEERLKDVGEQLGVENFEDPNSGIDLEKINDFVKEMTEQDLSIIVDGSTLEVILADEDLSKLFFLISVAAKSVVCCRVSPKQKAKVVQLTRKNGKWVTLSIGDGANDVPMIMEANIGVGIQGKEGTQAVRSADYAIGQFRYLEKLLLVYGRNGYVKITKFICYYFYKNIILVFTELALALFNGYSGQIFFADYLGTMYNAFFTSWPCLFTFSLEREHDLNICKKFPVLYRAGPKNYYFNFKTFWAYIIYAIIHSALAFYIPTVGLYDQVGSSGFTFNHWRLSTISFSIVIHVVTVKLLLISNFWNVLNILAAIGSLGFYYFCLLVLSSETFSKNFQPELTGVALDILTNFKGLLVIFLTPLISLLPDIIFSQFGYNMYPSPPQLLRKFINSPEVKKILMADSSDLRKKNLSLPDKSEAQTIFGGKKTLNLVTQGYNTLNENSQASRHPIRDGNRGELGLVKKEEIQNEFDTKNNLKSDNDRESESPFHVRKKSNRKDSNLGEPSATNKKKVQVQLPGFKTQTVIEMMHDPGKMQMADNPHEIVAQEDKDMVNIFQK